MFLKDKIKLKYILAIMFLVVLLLSFTQSFIYVDYLSYNYNVYAFNLLGPLVTLIGGILYIAYLLKGKYHKNFYYIILVIFISYIYTVLHLLFNYIFQNPHKTFDFSNAIYGKPKLGLFLYFCSMIIFFVDYFIIGPFKNKDKNGVDKMIDSPIDVQNQYLLAYYKEGLNKKFDNPIGNFSVLVIQKDSKKIEYCIYMPKSIREKILEENIISINVYEKSEELPTTISEDEKSSIIAFLFKKMGAFIASNELLEYIEDYSKRAVTQVYRIEIDYYDEKKQEQRIVFVSKNNPSEILKNINIPN